MTKCDECGRELDVWTLPDDEDPKNHNVICDDCCNKLGIELVEEWPPQPEDYLV